MRIIWCYFSTNSRAFRDTYRDGSIDWSERITLRWFHTLQQFHLMFSANRNFGSDSLSHVEGLLFDSTMLALLRDCTSESMNPRPCFQALQYHLCSLLLLATLLFLFIHIIKTYFYYPYYTCITSLHRTSAPIQFAIVLCVLGTQEISCIWLQGCLRDAIFILCLPRIDKP